VRIQVNSYSGFKLNERPIRFVLDEHSYEVKEVLDQWHSPESTYFKVRASDNNLYILRYSSAKDAWTLESYRRVAQGL